MKILLDIDGVLVTTPSWRTVEQHEDGFMKFNETATRNLTALIMQTNAEIVLATTHRISYDVDKWIQIFKGREIPVTRLTKINEVNSIQEMKDRGSEIQEWVNHFGEGEQYIILDDDLSISKLPKRITDRWVKMKSLLGFDSESLDRAIKILQGN
jgi:hypothetical protein